nr:MAG TPA: hypothetical protein [Caudoviricetes sp.]
MRKENCRFERSRTRKCLEMCFNSWRANRRLQEMSVLENGAGPGRSGGKSQFDRVVLLRC